MSVPNQSRNMKIVFFLTLIRLPLSVCFVLLLLLTERSYTMVTAAILLLMVMHTTDLLDGFLARRLNVVTKLGSAIDPYTDSIARLLVYSALAYKGYVLPIHPITMAFRDITVAYSRIVFVLNNKTPAAKKSGKINTGAQASGMFILLLGPFFSWWSQLNLVEICSYTLVTISLLSAIQYVAAALKINSEAMREAAKEKGKEK
ncbi:MAG: CDP-alcohol phosphatidyltransferase family protein [Candidatus Electryonea clarkiae]|nr:CDP-alcohol phosphatidyltransferase family protein [Candidatus Electryonea clarkiae]MDP8288224.1 CDP-alcohol phosphatidyltransferase family protein [Candidatus Electryonea clarkiae]